MVKQVLHWAGSLVAVLCVYTLLHTGTLTYEEAGLIILLLVALATFLAGGHVGVQFYLLGTLLAVTAVVVVYVEEFMWIIAIASILIVAASYFWNKRKTLE